MAVNFLKIIVAVSTLLRSLGIFILNGFNEELDDRFNDNHIVLWSVMKALLPENDDFLNCTVLEYLVELLCIVNSIILRDSSTAQCNLKNRLASQCTIFYSKLSKLFSDINIYSINSFNNREFEQREPTPTMPWHKALEIKFFEVANTPV